MYQPSERALRWMEYRLMKDIPAGIDYEILSYHLETSRGIVVNLYQSQYVTEEYKNFLSYTIYPLITSLFKKGYRLLNVENLWQRYVEWTYNNKWQNYINHPESFVDLYITNLISTGDINKVIE
jgi:hypothetical protein